MKLKHTIQFLDLKYTNNLVRNIRIFRTKNNFDIGVSTGFVLAPTCSTTKRHPFGCRFGWSERGSRKKCRIRGSSREPCGIVFRRHIPMPVRKAKLCRGDPFRGFGNIYLFQSPKTYPNFSR